MVISPFLVPIVFFISFPVTIIGVMLARAHMRQMERGSRTELSPELAERLDRMEQAMEAIAVEVERVSEGQRFTTKLLAERGGTPAASENNPKGGTPWTKT
jgi:ribonuclease D